MFWDFSIGTFSNHNVCSEFRDVALIGRGIMSGTLTASEPVAINTAVAVNGPVAVQGRSMRKWTGPRKVDLSPSMVLALLSKIPSPKCNTQTQAKKPVSNTRLDHMKTLALGGVEVAGDEVPMNAACKAGSLHKSTGSQKGRLLLYE